MTDKFLAMMRQCEREALTHSCSLHRDSAPSKRFAAAAADWRAMQEAWEAMVEALEWLGEPPYPIGSNAEFAHLAKQWAKAALAKARGK